MTGGGRDGFEGPAQHLLLEPAQPRRGVEAELVAEPVAVAGQGGEGVGRPASLGEGGDQELHRPFPPRLRRHDGLESGRGLGDPVQPEQEDRAVLLGGQPELVEAQRLSPGEGRRELGIGRAPPQGERLVQQGERGRGRLGGACLAEQPGEALGVDGVGGHLQHVAGGRVATTRPPPRGLGAAGRRRSGGRCGPPAAGPPRTPRRPARSPGRRGHAAAGARPAAPAGAPPAPGRVGRRPGPRAAPGCRARPALPARSPGHHRIPPPTPPTPCAAVRRLYAG
jgi:hypothetical protein